MAASAATVIRDARVRAKLTQAQLADRAQVSQSVVSAYESSRREPGFEMLRKLVGAAGFTLEVVLSPALPVPPSRHLIHEHRDAITRAVAEEGASSVRLFGSVARGEEKPGSDVDLLVDVGEGVGLFALGRMRSAIEAIVGAPVDIVPLNGVKPDALDRILAEAIPL